MPARAEMDHCRTKHRASDRQPPCRRSVLAGVIAFLLGAETASAADFLLEPIVLRYRASAECPSEPEFRAMLQERARGAELREASEAERVFDVVLATTARGASGTFFVVERRAVSLPRRIQGPNCQEVAEAIALLAALAVSPDSVSLPTTSDPSTEPTANDAERALGSTDARRRSLLVVLGGAARRDLPARWGFGGRVEASVRRHGPKSHRPLGAVGLGVSYARTPSFDVPPGAARFWLLGLDVRVTPWILRLGAHVELWAPTIGLEIGFLRGQGLDVARPNTRGAFFSAGLAAVRLLGAISDTLVLTAEVGASFPFVRHRFVFSEPSATIGRVPPIGLVTALGIGIRSW